MVYSLHGRCVRNSGISDSCCEPKFIAAQMHFAAILVIKDPHAMAKSLSSILSQIERLQKEAASIQLEVIDRVRKEIAKYGLTPDQLFGEVKSRGARAAKPAKKASKARATKYADGSGNTWGGMGKRPEWLRQALEAGKALEEFLIGGNKPKAASSTRAGKPAVKAKRQSAAAVKVAAKKRAPAAKAARKPRKARAAEAPAAE